MAEKKTNEYMPQLDGLRAIAVLCIMWHHWAPDRFNTGIPLDRAVQLFFVLSGFLITGILLDARARAEATENSLVEVFVSFYARRMLRIFPLYYLVLAVACYFQVAGLPAGWRWHALYASNFYFLSSPGWGTPIGHFWSLAVEEQFYLLWPALILCLRVRSIPAVLAVTAVVGPLYRMAGSYTNSNGIWFIGTPGSFDSLAIGGFVAYGCRYTKGAWRTSARYRLLAFLVALFAYVIITIPGCPGWLRYFDFSFLSVAFGVVVFQAALGFRGICGSLLSSWVLRYIGKISYGLYVFHNFASIPTRELLRLFPQLKLVPGNFLLCNLAITFCASSLSWYLLESPLSLLKKHFPYTSRSVSDDSVSMTERGLPPAKS